MFFQPSPPPFTYNQSLLPIRFTLNSAIYIFWLNIMAINVSGHNSNIMSLRSRIARNLSLKRIVTTIQIELNIAGAATWNDHAGDF